MQEGDLAPRDDDDNDDDEEDDAEEEGEEDEYELEDDDEGAGSGDESESDDEDEVEEGGVKVKRTTQMLNDFYSVSPNSEQYPSCTIIPIVRPSVGVRRRRGADSYRPTTEMARMTMMKPRRNSSRNQRPLRNAKPTTTSTARPRRQRLKIVVQIYTMPRLNGSKDTYRIHPRGGGLRLRRNVNKLSRVLKSCKVSHSSLVKSWLLQSLPPSPDSRL